MPIAKLQRKHSWVLAEKLDLAHSVSKHTAQLAGKLLMPRRDPTTVAAIWWISHQPRQRDLWLSRCSVGAWVVLLRNINFEVPDFKLFVYKLTHEAANALADEIHNQRVEGERVTRVYTMDGLEGNLFSRSGLNAYIDWQARFIKILAFKTANVAGISELI